MTAPVRFPSGVTNVGPTNPLGQFGMPDPTKWHTYFNDFDTYVVGDWTLTTTEAGSGSATEALGDVDGGVLVVTNDNADDDNDFFQKLGVSFLLAAGKKAFFKTRLKVSDATQCDFQVGLVVKDTSPLDATDGIYFQKDDGDALLDVYCRKNASTGSTSATGIATVVDDTFLEMAWFYDGKSEVSYFVNGVKLGTLDGSSAYLPDAQLTVSFGIQNGEAVAKVLTIDYVFAAKER